MYLPCLLRTGTLLCVLVLGFTIQAQVTVQNSGHDTTMIILDNGNVGIGTVSPQHKLEVIGTIKATSFIGNGSGLTGTGDNLGNHSSTQNLRLNSFWLSGDGGNEGLFINTAGQIGLGTNDPDAAVEANKDLYIGGDGNIETGETVGTLGWFNNDANSLNQLIGGIRMINRNSWWDSDVSKLDAAMTFSIMENSIVNEAMRIDYNGRVGIGATNPAYNLEVNGTFQADHIRSGTLDLPVAPGISGQFLRFDGTWALPSGSTYTAGDDLDLIGTEFSLEDDISISYLRASYGTGLKLYDDGGNMALQVADGGFVGLGTSALSGNARLEIANMATGVSGLKIFSPGQSGMVVQTPAVNGVYVTNPGYYGFAVDSPVLGGYYVNNSATHGMYVNHSTQNGISVINSLNHGIRVSSSGWWGVVVDTTGWSGICIKHTGTHGLDIYSTGQHGIQITQASEDGIHVSSATQDGVEANTDNIAGEWGVYTPNKIYGSNITVKTMSLYGYNDGTASLEPGDIVAVSTDSQALTEGPEGSLVMKVTKAGPENSEAVVGVVEYRVMIETQQEVTVNGTVQTKERFAYAGTSVNRGDYLSIVVFGIADVKISGLEKISAGQKLTLSDLSGTARAISPTDGWSSGILGKALESSNGKGSIKTLVNCK